jgi:hypothetical protein
MSSSSRGFVVMVIAVLGAAGCSTASTGFGGDGGDGTSDDAAGGDGSVTGDDGGGGGDGTTSKPDGGGPGADGGTTADGGGSSSDSSTPQGMDSGTPAMDSGGMTTNESEWLDGMNAARAAVGESPLVWDPIAAQVAAGYAAMCNFVHNPNRNSQYQALGGGSGGLGENIAAGAPTQSPQAAVTSWVNEISCYDHASNTCSTSGSCAGTECGHYTQIVWKSTTAVGCAHYSCTTNSPFGSQFPDWDYSVCDYSPPGNYVGQSPY